MLQVGNLTEFSQLPHEVGTIPISFFNETPRPGRG